MGPKPKKDKKGKKKVEEEQEEPSGLLANSISLIPRVLTCQYFFLVEYDNMDLEMLREIVPMLRTQLDKSMLDRNYVQLERVSFPWSSLTSFERLF
jgi:hypothetical protein